jgi:histidine triad (HIT) family protein
VYGDEHVVAFMDIMPVTPGHLLVVPRVHVDFLRALDEEVGARIFRVAHHLAKALYRSGLPCEGVNIFLADGEAAFQEIFHVHLHVFPRFSGDGFRIDAEWRQAERAELDAAAAHVRDGLESGSAARIGGCQVAAAKDPGGAGVNGGRQQRASVTTNDIDAPEDPT